jgi:hypothetical protein
MSSYPCSELSVKACARASGDPFQPRSALSVELAMFHTECKSLCKGIAEQHQPGCFFLVSSENYYLSLLTSLSDIEAGSPLIVPVHIFLIPLSIAA